VDTASQKVSVTEATDKLYEFERAPVTPDKLQPGRYFAGLFAGEHVAGTEFVIGALFVAKGCTAWDIFVGLALGNLLAVLMWTFLCAPIAVRTRLTLYWYLRQVGGPVVTVAYNLLNAFMFAILAGSMITVSASAVCAALGIQINTLALFPDNPLFVIVTLLVGAVVVLLAVLGFKRLGQFAVVCSPWMILMFLAGALALLPTLSTLARNVPGMENLGGIHSWNDFWRVANAVIWTGQTPDGSAPWTFWQVAAFAAICNLAMNAGLADMALFRYARHWSYGLYSSLGMFLGHYMAWICAGMMGAATALAFQRPLNTISSGELAYFALGASGIIAVIVAGWTTSNPTIYRVGLALQVLTPNWPRWKVTAAAGIITTIVACSPFVFTRLLDFVGLYGLLCMPVGAIVLTEHWLFPRLGMTQCWATRNGRNCWWPAMAAWIGSLVIVCSVTPQFGVIQLFHDNFRFIPAFFLTVILYTVFARIAGAARMPAGADDSCAATAGSTVSTASGSMIPPIPAGRTRSPLEWAVGGVALLCLIICIGWSLLVAFAGFDFDAFKRGLIVPTIIYFIFGTWYLMLRESEKQTT